METTLTEGASISVDMVSPGWPVQRCTNGIVSYIAALAPGLVNRGTRVGILAHGEGPSNDENVTFLRFLDNDTNPLRRLAGKIHRKFVGVEACHRASASAIVRAVAASHDPTALEILEMPETFGTARYVASRSPVPVIVRLHGPWFLVGLALGECQDRTYARRVKREDQSMVAAHGVTAPSHSVLEAVRLRLDGKLPVSQVIANPIAPVAEGENWRPNECDRNRILFIGRFDRCKGADVMIDAFVDLIKRRPRARLTFVGPERSVVDDRGKRWALEEFLTDRLPGSAVRAKVEVLGTQPYDRLGSSRRRAFVTVVPSRYETFGNTAIEAMNLGCPVVAARVGGLAEIIQDGSNGLLFEPGDANGLAERIVHLLDRPHFAAQLGAQAKRDCHQRYHPDVIARQTVEFYQRVIESWRTYRRRKRRTRSP